jgi:hypothetical protein
MTYIENLKIIMSTQNNLIIITGSAKHCGAQLYIYIYIHSSQIFERQKKMAYKISGSVRKTASS